MELGITDSAIEKPVTIQRLQNCIKIKFEELFIKGFAT